jgi:hypothetical protein
MLLTSCGPTTIKCTINVQGNVETAHCTDGVQWMSLVKIKAMDGSPQIRYEWKMPITLKPAQQTF